MPNTDVTAWRGSDAVIHYTVAYPDTDAAGVVFHGRYLEMAERARNHLIHAAGFTYASLAQEHDTLLTVHKLQAVYHGSGILEDRLQIRTKLTASGPVRTVWLTEVVRVDALLASVNAEIVALYPRTRHVRQFPQILLHALAPYVERAEQKAAS